MRNFDVENFVFKNDIFKNKTDYFILDRICKKIDVVNKVFKFYTLDLAKKMSSEEVELKTYKELYKHLTNDVVIDFKFINTAYKLNDILYKRNLLPDIEYLKNQQELDRKVERLQMELNK